MKVILYTTHCPKCEILKQKLDDKNIEYEMVTDIKVMLNKGFMSAPMLEVDGEVMDYMSATQWMQQQQ